MIKVRFLVVGVALACAALTAANSNHATVSSAVSLPVSSNNLSINTAKACTTAKLTLGLNLVTSVLSINNIPAACWNKPMSIQLASSLGGGVTLNGTATSSSMSMPVVSGLLASLTSAQILVDGWSVPCTNLLGV